MSGSLIVQVGVAQTHSDTEGFVQSFHLLKWATVKALTGLLQNRCSHITESVCFWVGLQLFYLSSIRKLKVPENWTFRFYRSGGTETSLLTGGPGVSPSVFPAQLGWSPPSVSALQLQPPDSSICEEHCCESLSCFSFFSLSKCCCFSRKQLIRMTAEALLILQGNSSVTARS